MSKTARDKIHELRALHDDGLLSQEEFDRRKNAILDAQLAPTGPKRGPRIYVPENGTELGLAAGQEVGPVDKRYRLERQLGQGGMGQVWLAIDLATQAELGHSDKVALKILPPEWTQSSLHARLLVEEATKARKLAHEHIVRVYEWAQDPATTCYFIIMEYLEGDDLDRLLAERGPFSMPQVQQFLQPVAQALRYAWDKHQLVHRDLKPSNLFLTGQSEIKLLDFGIAARVRDVVGSAIPANAGTAGYRAPEAGLRQRVPGPQLDVYALAVMIYQMVMGELPFGDVRQIQQVPTQPRMLDARQWRLLQRGFAWQPEARPASALELLNDLFQSEVLVLSSPPVLPDLPLAQPAPGPRLAAVHVTTPSAQVSSAPGNVLTTHAAVLQEQQKKQAREQAQIQAQRQAQLQAQARLQAQIQAQEVAQKLAQEQRKQEAVARTAALREQARRLREEQQQRQAQEEKAARQEQERKRQEQERKRQEQLLAQQKRSEQAQARLRESQAQVQPEAPGVAFRDNFLDHSGVGPLLVVLPAGRFLMGSPDAERQTALQAGASGSWLRRETPVHWVGIERSFAIARHPVTVGEWRQFAKATGWQDESENNWQQPGFAQDENHPVVWISWHDAQSYCAWLSSVTGHTYRLASEAEWEFACRAGSKTAFHFGDQIETGLANYDGNFTWNGGVKGECLRGTTPAGRFAPNAWGVYDMHGNVWEWVQDVVHDHYEGAPLDGSAWESAGDPGRRVLRGGSWLYGPRYARSASRNGYGASGRNDIVGARVVRELPELTELPELPATPDPLP
jgi:formylglycine-generating enzyme required for sulfatase activity/serine/threonine protein kinase